MHIEGTVQISIKDFEELKGEARRYEMLCDRIGRCVNVKDVEKSDDNWQQVITVNAGMVLKLASEFGDHGGIYSGDILKFSEGDFSITVN